MRKFIDILLIAFWVCFGGIVLWGYFLSVTTHPRPGPDQWSKQIIDGEEIIVYPSNKK